MKLRLFGFAALAATVLSPLAGCSGDALPSSSGGAGGSAPAPGGMAGLGSAAAGQSTGGGGQGTAGLGSAVAGSQSTGGGGQGTAGSLAEGGSSGSSPSSGGSSGNAGGGSVIPPTFATLKEVLLDASTAHACFGGLCHDFPENQYFRLKKEGGAAYTDDELHTMVTTYQTKNCGPAIDTANAGESGLIKILKGTCSGTERMPQQKCYFDEELGADTEGCVPADYVAAIEAWIAAGAPK